MSGRNQRLVLVGRRSLCLRPLRIYTKDLQALQGPGRKVGPHTWNLISPALSTTLNCQEKHKVLLASLVNESCPDQLAALQVTVAWRHPCEQVQGPWLTALLHSGSTVCHVGLLNSLGNKCESSTCF